MDNRNAGVRIKKVKLKVGAVLRFKEDWEWMVTFLQKYGLMPEEKSCDNCGHDLVVQEANKNKDGALWRYVIQLFDSFIWFFLKNLIDGRFLYGTVGFLMGRSVFLWGDHDRAFMGYIWVLGIGIVKGFLLGIYGLNTYRGIYGY